MAMGFKGFELADKKFDRKIVNCADVVEDSCGTRNCQLEVYTIGDNEVYVGGACPKGNSVGGSKKAPNYVGIYKDIFHRNLEGVVSSLEDSEGEERVLIPKSLSFWNEKGVLYASFYKGLGFDIALSKDSDEEIDALGKKYAHADSCYPIILAHGHAAFLKSKAVKGLDKILLPNVISSGEDELSFCPYVQSSGFLLKSGLGLKDEDVLIPVLRFGNPKYPLEDAFYKDLERVFPGRFSKGEIKGAVRFALEKERRFLEDVHSTGAKILNSLLKNGEKIFVGVGRGYTLFDDKASSKVHELFMEKGLHFIPGYFFDSSEFSGLAKEFVDNLYWFQADKMISQMLVSSKDKRVFPVRLTNFNCGTDSINSYHEDDVAGALKKPYLVLETDGHNSNAQFGTRIMAHDRVTDEYLKKNIGGFHIASKKKDYSLEGRVIGIPYMGDSSDAAAASFEAFGFESEVMPSATQESFRIAKRIVSTNTCRPFAFQVGDHLSWLNLMKESGMNPNERAALFLPSARGPCRFGQYAVVLRKILDKEGFENVPIISPNAAENYSNVPIDKRLIGRLNNLSFQGMTANSVLQKALLRVRPYEFFEGESDAVYNEVHKGLLDVIRSNPRFRDLRDFMKYGFERFDKIDFDRDARFPRVLVNGEIFMRLHEGANEDSVRLLEKNGLEVVLDLPSTWVRYVNEINAKRAFEKKEFLKWLKLGIKEFYMDRYERKLGEPFESLIGRGSEKPIELIRVLERDNLFDSAVQGESGISIGEAYAFVKGESDLDGIYHIGPFGCMQETSASSIMHSIARGSGRIVPIMDAVFGEGADSNLEARIALFAERVRGAKEINE